MPIVNCNRRLVCSSGLDEAEKWRKIRVVLVVSQRYAGGFWYFGQKAIPGDVPSPSVGVWSPGTSRVVS